jgi:hypothetical protein
MSITPVFEKVFGRLYGELCWGISPGHGSFLTLEFGKPHLGIREPAVAKQDASAAVRSRLTSRSVDVQGERRLWICCCDWAVFYAGKRIVDSTTKLKIRTAADFLGGQNQSGFRKRREIRDGNSSLTLGQRSVPGHTTAKANSGCCLNHRARFCWCVQTGVRSISTPTGP